jgi:hypothetical protein
MASTAAAAVPTAATAAAAPGSTAVVSDLDHVDEIMNRGEPAELVLDDGSRFDGWSFGALRPVTGEAVFQTGAWHACTSLFPSKNVA